MRFQNFQFSFLIFKKFQKFQSFHHFRQVGNILNFTLESEEIS
jgi:hypothetical protein